MTPAQRRIMSMVLGFSIMGGAGCSSSSTSPAFTPEEEKAAIKKEMSGEFKRLIELEKEFGSDHSQVRQMKMELGLDPDRPASEQIP